MGGAETQGVGGQRFREKGGQVEIRERGVRDTERERQRPDRKGKKEMPHTPRKEHKRNGGLSEQWLQPLSLP